MVELSFDGGLSPEQEVLASEIWTAEAKAAGVDLTGFNLAGSLEERLSWAKANDFTIAAVLSRFSTKLQQSTEDQMRSCLTFAAQHKMYVPPEYICVDEAVSGRKSRRDGLERMRQILGEKLVKVLLVFKVSRLFRHPYRGYQLFQEELVEEGMRGVSVSQGIDTADEKSWKPLMVLHGLSDEMLLSAIADHVRDSLTGHFGKGYVTGALPVGYVAQEIPDARPTNRGRPRTVPAVHAETAALIRQHYEWIRAGMSITEGLRRWVRSGGPCDPRSTTKRMTYPAYRRLLSNPRYTGRWAFGRKRNQWNSKRDYTRQIEGPSTEIVILHSEGLRIVDDELFHAVQAVLEARSTGPRGPKPGKAKKSPRLCDLVTDCFICHACNERFYVGGAHGKGMRCKRGALCPHPVVVDRQTAVNAVCEVLGQALLADTELLETTIQLAVERDCCGDEARQDELTGIEKRIAALSRRIEDLTELAGEGTDADRAAFKAKVRHARTERSRLQAEAAQLQRLLAGPATVITPLEVRSLLTNFQSLLASAGSGQLGEDLIYEAGALFRKLTGGCIRVEAVPRPKRKRPDVKATFTPAVLRTAMSQLGISATNEQDPRSKAKLLRTVTTSSSNELHVWLRRPDKDAFAEEVCRLIDQEGLSYPEVAKRLSTAGRAVTAATVWQMRRRHYEMTGKPVPSRPYNNGRTRKASSSNRPPSEKAL